ncbi:MAG: hypothetical protein WDM96_12335 [Lacunisphaera sp.]
MATNHAPMELPEKPIPPAAARYFITLVTKDHGPWLAVPRTRDAFLAVLRAWHEGRNGRILAVSALPDHVHILMELGSLLTAGQVVSGWKAAVRRATGYAETFHENFREHRLAEAEAVEDYGLYMFLAPYRARLLLAIQTWDGWWAPVADVFQFPASLNAMGGPPEEWVNWPAARFAGLAGGNR